MPANTRNTACVVLWRDDMVLLQRRSKNAAHYASLWDLFGGEIEDGESAEAAAVRELREELEIPVAAKALVNLGSYSDVDSGTTFKFHYFSARLDCPLSELSLHEGAGFCLFDRDELPETMAPGCRFAIDAHFEQRFAEA